MTLIETQDLTKTYQMGEVEVHALKGVDLKADKGEFIVILGPSGSGKTTLLNIVGAIDTPTTGRIFFNGEEVTLTSKGQTEHRRNNIGFIFQFFNLLPTLNALENVEMALELSGVPMPDDGRDFSKKAIRERARLLLEKVGLADRSFHFPAELSGGEQQRVSIARALAKDPPMVVADEPTGSLDFKTGIEILRELRRLRREEEKTILLVTHNREIAKIANRVIEMHDGRLGEDRQNEPAELESLRW